MQANMNWPVDMFLSLHVWAVRHNYKERNNFQPNICLNDILPPPVTFSFPLNI